MPKLIFRYGAMGSSKTANALMVRYNYVEKGKKVVLLKPKCENRDGEKTIRSRIGLEDPCEFAEEFLEQYSGEHYDCIIVDEVQFLAAEVINRLSDLVDTYGITVICYGLRTDFRSELFPGAKRLMELADDIEQIKTICWCGKRAHFNARILNGEMVTEGEQVQLGGNESYMALCRKHYKERQIKPQK
ncbi:thymidine kinase [Ruminococcus champanellensis]|nr:thymidine kinase [Ruminococcus champanellensis]